MTKLEMTPLEFILLIGLALMIVDAKLGGQIILMALACHLIGLVFVALLEKAEELHDRWTHRKNKMTKHDYIVLLGGAAIIGAMTPPDMRPTAIVVYALIILIARKILEQKHYVLQLREEDNC